jgi:hypothetical protein
MDVHDRGVARPAQNEIDDGWIVDDRIGIRHADERGDAPRRRRLARALQRLPMLGPRLADEGAHVDSPGDKDMTAALDDVRAIGSCGRGAPDEVGDAAVAGEKAAAVIPARSGIDEAGVGEEERGH